MIKITTIALLISAALALSACGKPASVSAGSEEKASAEVHSKESFSEKISHGHASKANVTFPATGLILDALFSRGEIADLGDWRTKKNGMSALLDVMSAETARENTSREDAFRNKIRLLAGLQAADTLSKEDVEMALRNEQLKLARIPIAIAFDNYAGWEVSARRHDLAQHLYLTAIEASGNFSSQVLAGLAGQMAAEVWANPDEARRQIEKLWYAQDPAALNRLWIAAVSNAEKNHDLRVINLSSSSRGVDWRADNTTYSGQAKGLIFERAGQVWFGDGYLEGRQYSIGLDSSYAKAGEESSGGEKGIRESAGTSASGSAAPK